MFEGPPLCFHTQIWEWSRCLCVLFSVKMFPYARHDFWVDSLWLLEMSIRHSKWLGYRGKWVKINWPALCPACIWFLLEMTRQTLSPAKNPARAKALSIPAPQPILTCTVLLRNVVVDTDVIHSDPTKVSFPDLTFKNHLKKKSEVVFTIF